MKRTRPVDMTLTCKMCSSDFVFTAKEQHFFEAKGFPAKVRCDVCIEAKRGKPGQQPPTLHDAETEAKLDLWVSAKRSKDFVTADRLREELRAAGVEPDVVRASGFVALKPSRLADSKSAAQTRCFNCGKKGHPSASCPLPQGSTACFVCGQEGHLSRDCPQTPEKKVVSASAAKCFNCGKQGHLSTACLVPKMSEGSCYACGQSGHTSRSCPTPWVQAQKLDVTKIEALVAERKALRTSGDYEAADRVKATLAALGVTVHDPNKAHPDQYTWSAPGKPRDARPARQTLVCFAFQKGECSRGEGCRFAHSTAGADTLAPST